MGDNNVHHVKNLEDRLESINNKWMSVNNEKKSNYISNEVKTGGMLTVLGAIVGGLVGGPVGAVAGAALGGGGSASYSVYKSY